MQKITPIRWIFIIQFIFIQSFALKAQVLDATFSSPTQSVCAGSYYTINANTSTYSYSSYNWTIGGLLNAPYTISGSSITIYAMSPGSCNVTLTVSEGGSTQTHTENNFFTVNPIPTMYPTPDQTVCSGQFTQLVNFTGTQPNIVYSWTHANPTIGFYPTSGVGPIPSFQAQNNSNSTLIDTFFVSPNLNGCNGTVDTFAIIVNPISTVISVPDQTICSGASTSSIIFSGSSSNAVYNWTNNNSSIGQVASGTGNIPSFPSQNISSIPQIATFVVTPILNECTWISDTFLLTILPLPIVNAGSDVSICQGASFVPVANGNASNYQWSNGLTDGVGFVPNASMYLTLTGSLDGCSSMDSVLVSVNPNPTISLSSTNGEDSLACDGAVSVFVTNGTAPFTYNWTNGTTMYTTPAPQGLCSGTYSVVVTDMMGCSSTGSVMVNDTLINPIISDTLTFTDNIYMDSTVIGSDTSAWIQNCSFDYTMAIGAMIDSYVDSGDSIIVTWVISLNDGGSIPIYATYFFSPGTAGVYDLTLQLVCSQKSGPKFLIAQSRLYFEGSVTGIQTLSKNVIHVFPNPANSTISVSGLDESFKYEIRDLQGKCVAQGENQNEIDITNLSASPYLLRVITEKDVRILKFIKH